MDETLAFALPAFMDYARLSVGCGTLLEQFRRREPVHAYLISGAQGLGKATFAKVLACALFCEDRERKPCGECPDCRSVLRGQNPDVLSIEPEGSRQIGVEKVREVIEAVSRHAFGAGYRVVILRPVERLTPQAQNCLLKSLEEPVSNVVFLLLAHEMTAILGTIASRCARVKLTPWPDEAVAGALDRLGYSRERIQKALPIADGNIGLALSALKEGDEAGALKGFLDKALTVKRDADVVSISTGVKDDREGAERYLSVLEQAFHHALLVRTGQMEASALRAYPEPWRGEAPQMPPESLLRLLEAVFQARRLMAGQVNWQSTIDQLMMKILEERTKWHQSLA